ncbi:hypothetical protein SAMN05216552_1006116 [Pseudoduganella namucuonensis]|uniref:Uncharacterized protein n=1 Tax=Pseudoduganella namucuonensis TaxID=1035707 RepID=A0A1I7HQU4_9BURK|nr:hypothetical protein SAMN05216552_1006116 [Pseudoduganella namucuonensis]
MKVNDEVNVRIGRVVIPAFLISDYQNVGYANTMMRPPIEIYGRFPLEGANGADFNYQHAFGNTNSCRWALGRPPVLRMRLLWSVPPSISSFKEAGMTNKMTSMVLCALLAAALPASAETVVIVNPKNPATHMFSEQAAQFLLGKSTMFTQIDQAEGSAVRQDFYRKVANMEEARVKAI